MWRYDGDDEEKGKEKGSESDRLTNKLIDARALILADEVSDSLYRHVATMMTILERRDPKAPITVYINSPGGSADSGFAIFDLLRFSPCPILTVANGVVASAAVTIYLGTPKERRVSLPNSRFLLHQPSTAMRGQATDIDITAREILKLRARYNQIVHEATGKAIEQVTKDSDRDFWLTATEAADYGLVGRVIKRRAELEELAR
ncbi:MAG: ATP-dependent Clp protease proteolytic subunit [Polyangiaceae bacterium]|nr:ATP-dependent Clp protease proteolytic subunit [Polyangiaceae bacterium]